MSRLIGDPIAAWAAALIIVLPVVIIGAGEVQERLRQRGSPFAEPISTLRSWVLPSFTLWAIVTFVFEADPTAIWVRAMGTAFMLSSIVAALQIVRAFVKLVRERGREPGRRRAPELLLLLPRLLVLLIGGWLLFVVVWEVDLSGLFAALGITGIVISIALQDTLSGLASGFILLGDRPFNPGDWIRVGDLEGRVIDVNWRSSRIRNRNGDLVVVPNGVLAGETLVNFDEPSRLHRVQVPVQVAYSNPPSRARDMLHAAARATEGVLDDPAPDFKVVQIDDPLMGYEAQLWVDDYTIAPRVASDFGALVWYMSHRMDVPLPSPAFDLYHHDPIQEAADAEITVGELARRIRTAPLLTSLHDRDIEELAGAARAVRFRRSETMMAPSVVDRDLYIIWQGLARMTAGDPPVDLGDLGDGDVFGMLVGGTRSEAHAGVVAVTDCEVVIADAAAAGVVISRNPEFSRAFNQLQAARERRLQRYHAATVIDFTGAAADETDQGVATSGTGGAAEGKPQ